MCAAPPRGSLAGFTGTPDDRFYYAFRSGPLAALVMDTGEDKPDDSPYFGGMAAFQKMQRRQAEWLKGVVKEPWFRDAPHKVLFCHIPLWFTRDIFPDATALGMPRCLPRAVGADARRSRREARHLRPHARLTAGCPRRKASPSLNSSAARPQPKYATFIQGTATREPLTLKMSKLDGTVVADVTMNA